MALFGARAPDSDPGDGEEYALRDPMLYHPKDDAKIVGWRVDCFEALGFDHVRAVALAIHRDVDRQGVTDLIGAGATPEQVALIVL
jgi:hypothetical protein